MRAEEVCAQGFAEAHPIDAARLIEDYPAAEAADFLASVPAAVAAGVVERMSPIAGAACLAGMDPSRAAAVIGKLSAVVAIALLRRLPDAEQGPLMSALPDDLKDRFHHLLLHDDGTVGSITDPGVLALPLDLSVGQALRQLRQHPAVAHHHIYVVDRSQCLVGLLHIRDLVSAPPKGTLDGIMRPADERLAAMTRLTSAEAHPAWRHVDALPVTDDSGVLLGMVRHRQLRKLDAMQGPGDVARTVLGLGELYWLWLSTILSVAPHPLMPENREQSFEGGEHHA